MFYSHTSFEGMNRVMVPVGASLLLMTNIFIFTVFDRFVEKSEEVKKMARLYQKSRAEIANLQYMNKVNEDNRAFLHDINKFICTVAGLMEEGENQEVKEIMEHLHEFYKGKTVVVVAHRLSTVKDADKIVVLDKGRIMEEGTHQELTEKRGLYYELVKNQLELGQ